jgi:sirohydrochlorin ferrochelatase
MTMESVQSGDQATTKSTTGIIIVDHGSRRAESNTMLHQATERFAVDSKYQIVEPAHMEIAEPSIATAFDRCMQRGAKRVVVFPYFLSPGRHWTEDIPALVAAAAQKYADVEWLVTAPFGLHADMNAIIADRIEHCLGNALSIREHQASDGCDVCQSASHCQFELRSKDNS